jgi:hypothetical protein
MTVACICRDRDDQTWDLPGNEVGASYFSGGRIRLGGHEPIQHSEEPNNRRHKDTRFGVEEIELYMHNRDVTSRGLLMGHWLAS